MLWSFHVSKVIARVPLLTVDSTVKYKQDCRQSMANAEIQRLFLIVWICLKFWRYVENSSEIKIYAMPIRAFALGLLITPSRGWKFVCQKYLLKKKHNIEFFRKNNIFWITRNWKCIFFIEKIETPRWITRKRKDF